MKLALAIFLNAGLLIGLLPWLRREWQQARGWMRAAFAVGLGARLAWGFTTGLHPSSDSSFMSNYGHQITAQMWAEPMAAVQTLVGNEFHFGSYSLVFYGMSNTFFCMKILAFLNLASWQTDWLNSVYLSLFSFGGCWQLVRTLARVLPNTPAAAGAIAFGIWPSAIYWASGLTKEAVVLGSGAWLLALVVEALWSQPTTPNTSAGSRVLGIVMLTWLHFKMRYFFAIPLLGGLLELALVQLLQRLGLARSRWSQVAVLVAIFGGGIWLASEVSVAFRLNKFTSQVAKLYSHNIVASNGRPHFEYPDLQPTPASIARYLPQAAANALTRPWLGESDELKYVVGGLENLGLLLLLAVAIVAASRGRAGRLPFGLTLTLLVQCLALAMLLGLSTPNLGSMHRYRSGLLPYLLLLLLQNDYAVAVLRRLGLKNETSGLAEPPASVH
jgi:hypothetical protein